jgi:hypothetical protein
MKGVIAGVVAGIAGAVAWAIIAAVTGFEIGWLALGIGAAVGAAVAWGSKGSPRAGAIAVVITVLAIVGGKYLAVEIVLAKEMKAADEEIAPFIESGEYLISWLADEIVDEYEQEGKEFSWPAGVDPEDVYREQDYPPEIWNLAEVAWNDMNEYEKAEYKNYVEEQMDSNKKVFMAEVRKEGFIESFGVIDVIFFVLAVATAYKIAAKPDKPAAASAEQQDLPQQFGQ